MCDEANTLARTAWLTKSITEEEAAAQAWWWMRGLLPHDVTTFQQDDDDNTTATTKGFAEIAGGTGCIYTDGGGSPAWVPKPCAVVGAGAATLDIDHTTNPTDT